VNAQRPAEGWQRVKPFPVEALENFSVVKKAAANSASRLFVVA
jgi:hypothetical protein